MRVRRAIAGWLTAVLVGVGVTACSAGKGPTDTAAGGTVTSRLALIEFYPALGDLEANFRALASLVEEAFASGARFVITPELATTGYGVTKEGVAGGLGLSAPFPELAVFGRLAKEADGYLLLGLAEVDRRADGDVLFNSVAVFGPEGLIGVQRKRGLPLWNARGDLPIAVIPTPYGDVATIVCSDTYHPEWVRIAALRGADLLLVPANWWGEHDQVEIWQTRAQENGVWMAVANRWGRERNLRRKPAINDMNDAPTAVIAPDGEVRLVHRAKEEAEPRNRILYYDVEVPRSRIGPANPTYTLARRRTEAYGGLTRPREVWGRVPFPEMPPAGPVRAGVLAYVPEASAAANLAAVRRRLGEPGPDVVVLPGLGVSREPIACRDDAWTQKEPWAAVQRLVDETNVDLLVTSLYVACPRRLSLAVFRAGQPALLAAQIHDAWGMPGSGEPPLFLDLPHARVGVLLGVDSLFPETAAHLARSGADVLAVSSVVGETVPAPPSAPSPSGWDAEDLIRTWKTRSGECFHVAAADASGHGIVVRDGGCHTPEAVLADPGSPVQILSLDTGKQRKKLLSEYYGFDLEVLLEPN